MLHFRGHVLFGVQEEQLTALLVFKADLVEVVGSTAFRATGLHDGLRHVVRQRVGRHLIRVVHTADDNWPVRVSFEKVYEDLLADTGMRDPAPVLARPDAGDADPAGTVLVLLADAIPEELNLYPAVFIDIDFFAGGAHDHGRLHSRYGGSGGAA